MTGRRTSGGNSSPPRLDARTLEIVLAIAGAAAAFFLYHSLLSLYLYNDDFEWLSKARFEMHPGNVLGFRVVNFFRPVVNLSFFIQERMAPGNVPLYYGLNIALHALNTILAYLLLARIFADRRLAGAAAMLFLVTSLHYTAVAWISARTTLLSEFFLLLSLVVLLRYRSRRALAVALSCYALALLSKETAIAGLLLVLAFHAYARTARHLRVEGNAVVAYGVVTLVYLVVRLVVIGRLVENNWGPGVHALRNLAGGFLYHFYPWWLFSVWPPGQVIPVPSHPIWPEVLSLAVMAGLVGAAYLLRRARAMGLLILWTLIALAPPALFKFRFFTTAMVTQDRYYYLSSLAACAAIALLLVGLWDLRRGRTPARAAAVLLLAAIVAGECRQVGNRHQHWRRLTDYYRRLVTSAAAPLDRARGMSVCVVQEPIPARPYVMHGLRLERPEWRVEQVLSHEEAVGHRPCVYILVKSDGRTVSLGSETIE